MKKTHPYLRSYLAASMLVAIFFMADAIDSNHNAEQTGGDADPGKVLGALIGSLGLGLFAIPIRLLMGLFPEPSPHPFMRLFRRMLIGALCGPLPILLVFGLVQQNGQAGTLIGIGAIVGTMLGVIDSIVRDTDESQPDGGQESE